jgi:23S rRNA pseudouridine2605 synthase
MRLNRFLASAGLGSRRGCEELILAGRVTVNGDTCINLATQIQPSDAVKVNGHLVRTEQTLYVLLHKPRGYVCTADDEQGRRTIFDLLPRDWPRLFHVGRLDRDSEGLLILTNDGDLALRLTHPRYKIEKEYLVALDKPFDFEKHAEKMRRGFVIEGGRAQLEQITNDGHKIVRIVLRQGIKRQIRLMFYKLGYEVERLMRTRIGPLREDRLAPGAWRYLTPREVVLLSKPPAADRQGKPRAWKTPEPRKQPEAKLRRDSRHGTKRPAQRRAGR